MSYIKARNAKRQEARAKRGELGAVIRSSIARPIESGAALEWNPATRSIIRLNGFRVRRERI